MDGRARLPLEVADPNDAVGYSAAESQIAPIDELNVLEGKVVGAVVHDDVFLRHDDLAAWARCTMRRGTRTRRCGSWEPFAADSGGWCRSTPGTLSLSTIYR